MWYDGGMDKATICSMALGLVGSAHYAVGTPEYDACDLYFGQLYGELLAGHDWSFARRRVTLERCEHGWLMPCDCLRVIELRGLNNWRIYGGHLCAEDDAVADGEVVMVYTSSQLADRGELPDTMRMFARALILRLGGALAAAVVHDQRLSGWLMQEAEGARQEAMRLDTQQDNSNDQHPLTGMLGNSLTRGGF